MEILKIKPAMKDYIWGGNRLIKLFNKESDLDKIAETWELSTNKDGLSKIEGGEYDKRNFIDYINEKGNSVIGKDFDKEEFPVLIKLIDAKEALSIQVHPDDIYGKEHENSQGKTEMWYIVDADKDAFIYYGFKKEVTKEQLEDSIKNNYILDLLKKVPVKKGEYVFIEPGTIHAIGAGILICEIQQNSNITYRVYDYDRVGNDGKKRELHVSKAQDVARLKPNGEYEFTDENRINPYLKRLVKSEYFDVFKSNVKDGVLGYKVNKDTYQAIVFIEGEGLIVLEDESKIPFRKGDTFYIPAQEETIYYLEGKGSMILTTLPFVSPEEKLNLI